MAGDGPLARRKVFTRRDVVVAAAPALYGRDPAELDSGRRRRPAPTRRSCPLVGVAGASERAYACASVIAVETAIAANVAQGLDRTGSAVVPAQAVDAAIDRKEAELGRPLTHGQARAVRGICGSGRQVELVVGVAGSGKTTALACVRDAYQAAGYRVVGTSTSGQAARTLGREAGIDESRTLASLLWRLDHGRLTLDARTVVILDEAGMTADPDLLRVLVAAEAARAKVVLVGDDRQLGPVGPGGALGGLVERARRGRARAGRERPPGRPGRAAGPQPAPSRRRRPGGRLVRRTTAASPPPPPGTRRSTPWSTPGWPTPAPGSTPACTPGGGPTSPSSTSGPGPPGPPTATSPAPRSKRPAGAATPPATGSSPSPPAPTARSSPANAASSNTPTQLTAAFIVRMDDGRRHVLDRAETALDRLDHGYAVTVHRAQGATVDVAHRFEDGGGRELAYVSMSRARQRSTVHVVADNLDQAVEDLRRDWSSRAPPPLGHRHRHPHHRPPRRRTRTRRPGRAALVAAPSPPPSRTGRPPGAHPARPDPPAPPSRVPRRRPPPAAPGPRVRHRQLPARRDRRRRPDASRRRPAPNARRARPRRPEPRLADEAPLAPRPGRREGSRRRVPHPLRAARRAGAHQAHRRPARRRSRRPSRYAAKPTTTAAGCAPTPASRTGSAASTTSSAAKLRLPEPSMSPRSAQRTPDRDLGIEL